MVIFEQTTILYSVLQDKETDFQYEISKIESFNIFVISLRSNVKYLQFPNAVV